MSQATYEAVTFRILEALQKGVVPWRKPWQVGSAWPINGFSGREYRGINLFLLSCTKFQDHRWLTFRQARELGGYVKAGENSSIAVFWKRWNVEKEEEPKKTIPLLKHYHVFNVEQCEDIKIPPLNQKPLRPKNVRIKAAQDLICAMPDGPEIDENCTSAWYRPKVDLIGIPPFETFKSADAFYATLFHELGHATGHEKRLKRAGVMEETKFGSQSYGLEELVAELTSAFCCAMVGLDNSVIDDAAAYIDGWLKVLKGNPKAIVTAASQAQKAADLISNQTGKEPDERSS